MVSGTFIEHGTVKQHQGIQTVERTHLCIVCNKTFWNTGSLKEHHRVHTGERPYSCDLCNETFKNIYGLKVHQRVHSGERPYCCDVCNKTFIKTYNLKVHQRVHTGERQFICDMYYKTFKLLKHLNIHQRVHTGEFHIAVMCVIKHLGLSAELRPLITPLADTCGAGALWICSMIFTFSMYQEVHMYSVHSCCRVFNETPMRFPALSMFSYSIHCLVVV
jgi:hypothetical protein